MTSKRADPEVLDAKVTVITGAESGVGRPTAATGAQVVCADVNLEWAEETARQALDAGGTALDQQSDVTKEGDVVEAIAAVTTFGRLTGYGVTKGGVNHLTKGVAVECAHEDIRINAIWPAGMPFTNFMVPGAAEGSTGVDRDVGDAAGQMHPLVRPVTAEDRAAVAVFLASDAARNSTGVLLPIDGGYVAR